MEPRSQPNKTCITRTYVGKNDARKWLETAAIMGMCILDISGPPRYFKNLAGSQIVTLQYDTNHYFFKDCPSLGSNLGSFGFNLFSLSAALDQSATAPPKSTTSNLKSKPVSSVVIQDPRSVSSGHSDDHVDAVHGVELALRGE